MAPKHEGWRRIQGLCGRPKYAPLLDDPRNKVDNVYLYRFLGFVKRFLKYAFRIHDFGDKCYSTKPGLGISNVASVGQLLAIPAYFYVRPQKQRYYLGEDARFTDLEDRRRRTAEMKMNPAYSGVYRYAGQGIAAQICR